MNKIKEILSAIDETVQRLKPETMDDLISVVHSVPGAGNYGTSFSIVEYCGYLQGVRVYVTGRTKSHPLPTKDKVYSVFNGIDKYKAAGFKIEHK
jgi:hypothetical protein